jgi:hypothetical protein
MCEGQGATMSEGIVIALIGFAGAVLGAAIAGFATVTAAGIKGKGEGSISCGLVGLLASLGAAGGLVLGVVFGASVIQQRVASPQLPIVANPTQGLTVTQPVQQSTQVSQSQPSNYCFGNCWQYDDGARTMTWTGATNGIEDIWQPPGEALQKIRDGYTAIFSTSVPGEIFACVLVVNGQTVKNACDGVLYQIPPGTYRVTSANKSVGGFRWCPLIGYGWRTNGGECK